MKSWFNNLNFPHISDGCMMPSSYQECVVGGASAPGRPRAIPFADGMLYCREEADNSKSATGTMVLLEATPKGFQEKGRFDPPNRSDKHSWAHPVIAGGKLYLRDQEVLLCYDVKAM